MKILLIDNHALFREGVRHVLRQLPGGVDEILEAASFADALKLAGQHPDLNLVLLELKTPGSEGAISVRLFRRHYPHIPVVVLSGEEDCRIINQAMGYGASGFVRKDSSAATLLDTLKLALSSNICVRPQLLREFATTTWNKDNRDGRRGPNANEYGLTVRQMDILKYLTAGLSNKEIGAAVNLAEGTIKAHVAAIYHALRVKSRMEAMRATRELGLAEYAVKQEWQGHACDLMPA
ncbi:MAG: response regulator transcription factor [Gallionella sp.]|nr:response regulator transcription factor [Gallionella sp.]